MADVALVAGGTEPTPLDYTIPGAQELIPKAATASYDGSSAAGAYVPTLIVRAPNGAILAACPVGSSIAAGASVDVSWFPRVAAAAASASTAFESPYLTLQASDLTGSGYSTSLGDGTYYVVNWATAPTHSGYQWLEADGSTGSGAGDTSVTLTYFSYNHSAAAGSQVRILKPGLYAVLASLDTVEGNPLPGTGAPDPYQVDCLLDDLFTLGPGGRNDASNVRTMYPFFGNPSVPDDSSKPGGTGAVWIGLAAIRTVPHTLTPLSFFQNSGENYPTLQLTLSLELIRDIG